MSMNVSMSREGRRRLKGAGALGSGGAVIKDAEVYLVHELPCLLDGLPVYLQPGRRHGGREGPVQPSQEVVGEVSLACRHLDSRLLDF